MIKTLRISEENHKKLVVIQSKIQIKDEELRSMDYVIAELIEYYNDKKHGRRKA